MHPLNQALRHPGQGRADPEAECRVRLLASEMYQKALTRSESDSDL